MIVETLSSLGLSPKEIEVYLALLPLGSAKASVLAMQIHAKRSTTQYTCQQLEKKGIIFKTHVGKSYIYYPEPFEKLLLLLEQDKQRIEEKEKNVRNIIGELQGLASPDVVLPEVKLYEGKNGIISLYEEMLSFGEDIYSFEDKGEMKAFIPEYFPKFIKKRVEKGIFNYVICPASNEINPTHSGELRETRTIPVDDFPFSCDIKICGNLVSTLSFDANSAVGIAITHSDIAENYRRLFKLLWNKL